MRERERIDRILVLIKELWLLDEDSRFLQMIFNLERSYSKNNNNEGLVRYEEMENGRPWEKNYTDLFHLDDNKLEAYLGRLISEKKNMKYQNS